MSIQAMKQALEALGYGYDAARCTSAFDTIRNAEAALRAAIEAAEKQEPVAWMGEYNINDIRDHYTVVMRHKTDFSSMPDRVRPLYTTPQPAIPAEWRHKLEHIIACAKLWDETGISRVKAITREAEAMLAAAPKPENSHD